MSTTPAHARGWEHSLSSGPPASEEDGSRFCVRDRTERYVQPTLHSTGVGLFASHIQRRLTRPTSLGAVTDDDEIRHGWPPPEPSVR